MFTNLDTTLKHNVEMMDLQKAKLIVESYKNEIGYAIPITFTELGLRFKSSTDCNTDYIMFNHKRKFSAKISAIKFVRCGKLSHDTLRLRKQEYEV